jgi:flagellar basal-body rod protein FlgB
MGIAWYLAPSQKEQTVPFDIDSAFGIHAQAMQLRSRRAELLAANLANSDTPNYKARDIDFKSTLQEAAGLASAPRLRATDPRHIVDPGAGQSVDGSVAYRVAEQPSLDGNTVDTQVEKAAYLQNAVAYQTSLRFLDSRVRGLISALKGE